MATVIFSFLLLQKRYKSFGYAHEEPANEYSPFVGSSYVELLYYCGFNIDNLPAGRQVLLLGAVA